MGLPHPTGGRLFSFVSSSFFLGREKERLPSFSPLDQPDVLPVVDRTGRAVPSLSLFLPLSLQFHLVNDVFN